MKVKYRNRFVDIQNEPENLRGFVFVSTWNCYNIEIIKNERNFRISSKVPKEYYDSHKYEVMVTSPFGSCIVDGYSDSTIKKCLQEAIDNIASDIDDLMNRLEDLDEPQESRDEIAYWLGVMEQL